MALSYSFNLELMVHHETIQSNIPKVVHNCKVDNPPMFSASGRSADCTELQRVSDDGELNIEQWTLSSELTEN